MKRTIKDRKKEIQHTPIPLDSEFIKRCRREFNQKPENHIARNSLVLVGFLGSCTNSEEAGKVDHLFANTIKEEHTRATDQEASGRCWLFAGLNMYRHFLIRGMHIKNFEFSANYLFFYDKLERANYFLQEILQTLDLPSDDRYLRIRLKRPIIDGGHFSTFRDLVNKYGVIPKAAMSETYHSGYSEDMNIVLNKILRGYAWKIRREHKKLSSEEIKTYGQQILQQIYDALVKFLGAPPENFVWSFTNEEGEATKVADMTPEKFTKIGLFGISPNEYLVLAHIPSKTYGKVYEIQDRDCQMARASSNKFLNLPIREIKKVCLESILRKFPVWFSCDVTKGLHYFKFALDDKLFNTDMVFGPTEKMPKEERLKIYDEEGGNHAMVLIGVDIDEHGNPIRWQVENSWGYYDHETPGLDGFYTMSDEWFDEHVYEVVINYRFLDSKIIQKYQQEPIKLDYFDELTTAFRCDSK